LGIPEIASDIKFATSSAQLQNSEELREILANRFVSRTTEEWFPILEAQGILCARINTPAEALDNPQAKANDMIVNVDHPQFGELKLLGCPIRVNRRKNKSMPPPLHGEHTKDILEELNIKD
jgi:crotonobetainyl-CoA:carnitine CoA-transferase CaiB-like acyl-CoA transferase